MKKTVLFLLVILSCFATQAQKANYDNAIGFKFYPTGITFKHFLNEKTAVEGLFYAWSEGVKISALYEFHFFETGFDGLGWFIGPGAHVGFWTDKGKVNKGGSYAIGFDAIFGVDYKFDNVPFNVSLDWNPGITLVGSNGLDPGYGGLALRYTF